MADWTSSALRVGNPMGEEIQEQQGDGSDPVDCSGMQRMCRRLRSVTGMVDALEREGLITREPDPEDRRAILLRLTVDSRDRMERLHEAQNRLAEELLAPLGPEERAELHRMLTLFKGAAARGEAK